MATKSRKGFWFGLVKNRYQQHNPHSDRWDKYDGKGNFLKSKQSKGRWKNVEARKPMKPPRG